MTVGGVVLLVRLDHPRVGVLRCAERRVPDRAVPLRRAGRGARRLHPRADRRRVRAPHSGASERLGTPHERRRIRGRELVPRPHQPRHAALLGRTGLDRAHRAGPRGGCRRAGGACGRHPTTRMPAGLASSTLFTENQEATTTGRMTRQNPAVIKATLTGTPLLVSRGAMIAFQGDVTFAYEGSGGVGEVPEGRGDRRGHEADALRGHRRAVRLARRPQAAPARPGPGRAAVGVVAVAARVRRVDLLRHPDDQGRHRRHGRRRAVQRDAQRPRAR